ncbi:MAG: xylose isomerase [Abitibacteriaceae bacterium]|nr:xylose isomerase [Abditibacteriaceae bacterium]
MSDFTPKPKHKFTFGLWTVGNPGRDPFGEPTRLVVNPVDSVRRLAELGAYGVNLHDNDLVPFDASPAERDLIVKEFKKALKDTGMKVPMATTNLFTHPIFKDGAFTSNDPKVRAFATQKVMRSMDLGAELGAETYVFWGGREGTEVDASKSPLDALKWMRESLNFLNAYNLDQGYNFRLALEAKPNEPRGDIYLSTTGNMLAFIETLDHPENVGVNPEFAHETMANLNFTHHVAQAIDAGKLFHIDLNGQKPSRFDQDLRFGSEDQKGAFFLVKLLEDTGYDGPRHFDAHAYRSSDIEDVYNFAAGCMRSYLILKEKARQFNKDKEIQAILKQLRKGGDSPIATGYSKGAAEKLKAQDFDVEALTNRSLPYEQLDQLVVDLLLGVR